jgi:hypothetical protein
MEVTKKELREALDEILDDAHVAAGDLPEYAAETHMDWIDRIGSMLKRVLRHAEVPNVINIQVAQRTECVTPKCKGLLYWKGTLRPGGEAEIFCSGCDVVRADKITL